MRNSLLILFFLAGLSLLTEAQSLLTEARDARPAKRVLASDSLTSFVFPVRRICKGYSNETYFLWKKPEPAKTVSRIPGKPLLVIHGNILYDLNYRSQIDTPFKDREIYQHTVQVYLDVTYKDNYPFRVFFTTRFSNSSWFRSFSDLNLQYNANDFNNRVRRNVQQLLQENTGMDTLAKLKSRLAAKEREYLSLKDELTGSGLLQRLIKAREYKWLKTRQDLPGPSSASDTTGLGQSLNGIGRYKFGGHKSGSASGSGLDSASKNLSDTSAYLQQYDSTKRKLDSLFKEVGELEKRYQDLQGLQAGNADRQRQELDRIDNGPALKEKLRALHISDSSLPKGYQTLLSVKSFGIGRTMLDYSELSAKNISINGVQVEYNPSYYAAFAAGTVDYRYRDYTMQSPVKGQYIGLLRFGWGRKEGSHVILTYYTGRRQLYNSFTSPGTSSGSPETSIPNYSLMGFTLEGHYQVSRTSTFIAEIAKSSSPYNGLDSTRQHNMFGSALKLNDHSNEAYSLKYNAFVPFTQTQFTAGYLHYGANFQSFSLFTSGNERSAWSVRLSQPFFRRQLNITGSIRTNDFTNPLVNASYKSSTVFKSIQATLRIPKWPVLSVGYFPSSQIMKLNDNQFEENLFYTLTASASHVYRVHGISMISTLLYTQFYNKITDTNFVYFNTRNWMLSQHAFIGRLSWELQLSAAINTAYALYVIDNKADYVINHWLSLGAGIKYNKQTVYDILQWGYSGDAAIKVPKLGEFRFQADKGFIPGNNKQLVVYKTGRLTYLKTF